MKLGFTKFLGVCGGILDLGVFVLSAVPFSAAFNPTYGLTAGDFTATRKMLIRK